MNSPAEREQHLPQQPPTGLRRWLIASVLLHVALLALLLYVRPQARGAPPKASMQAFFVVVSAPVVAPPAPRPLPPVPAPPVKPVEPERKVLATTKPSSTIAKQPPAPTPKPPAAQPPAKPAAAASAVSKPGPPTPAPPPEEDFETAEDWVGRVRDLWLAPPDAPARFRCRLKISHAADGSILAVTLLRSCGDYLLDESVKRAAWKSAAMKLARAQQRAGVLEVDFIAP